jgi:hypothetical protein
MDIISDYRISNHWANDDADLDLIAERVRRAYDQLDQRQSAEAGRKPHRLGFLRRQRHA